MAILSGELFSKRGNLIHNRPIMKKVWVADLNKSATKSDIILSDMVKDESKGIIVKGLLDTGATTTCISRSLVAEHGFLPAGQTTVTSASHKAVPTSFYRIGAYIGYDQIIKTTKAGVDSLETKTGVLSPPAKIEAIEFAGADDFDIIVGMDVISLGLLLVSGSEDRVTITF